MSTKTAGAVGNFSAGLGNRFKMAYNENGYLIGGKNGYPLGERHREGERKCSQIGRRLMSYCGRSGTSA